MIKRLEQMLGRELTDKERTYLGWSPEIRDTVTGIIEAAYEAGMRKEVNKRLFPTALIGGREAFRALEIHRQAGKGERDE